MKASSRPFKAKQYGKCPIENGIDGEHHTIKKGDLIVRLETRVVWPEMRASIGMGGKPFVVKCNADYAHDNCLEAYNKKEQSNVR
jgi:hypothetical protein